MNEVNEVLDMFSVKGKIALVTGGYKGIGRMITEALVKGGCSKVYITGRNTEACETIAHELGKTEIEESETYRKS